MSINRHSGALARLSWASQVLGAAASEVEAWLDASDLHAHEEGGHRLHRELEGLCLDFLEAEQLLGSENSLKRSAVHSLNLAAESALRTAANAVHALEISPVVYRIQINESVEDYHDASFLDTINGVYLTSLFSVLVTLRSFSVKDQFQAMCVVKAIAEELNWRLSSTSVHLNLEDDSEAERFAFASAKHREAKHNLLSLKGSTPSRLFELAETISECRFDRDVEFPLVAPTVHPETSRADLLWAANCFEELARIVRPPFSSKLVGQRSEVVCAEDAWIRFRSSAIVLRVIAAWIRSLAVADLDGRCDLCYRHRATKRRCAEHKSSGTQSREARRALAIYPLFQSRQLDLASDASVMRAFSMVSSLDHPQSSLRPDSSQNAFMEPPKLKYPMRKLATQLMALCPLLTPKLTHDVGVLFDSMVSVAQEAVNQVAGGSPKDGRCNEAPYYLNIRNFLMLWYGSDVFINSPFRGSVQGRQYDRFHPLVRHNGSIVMELVAKDMLAQRAWSEVSCLFAAATEPDVTEMSALKESGHSLREIARILGCSHETVRSSLKKQEVQGAGQPSSKRARSNLRKTYITHSASIEKK